MLFGLQVKIFMPKYFLDTDEAITGEFGGEFGIDKGAYGNATLNLLVRSKDSKDWIFVMQQIFAPVSFLTVSSSNMAKQDNMYSSAIVKLLQSFIAFGNPSGLLEADSK